MSLKQCEGNVDTKRQDASKRVLYKYFFRTVADVHKTVNKVSTLLHNEVGPLCLLGEDVQCLLSAF